MPKKVCMKCGCFINGGMKNTSTVSIYSRGGKIRIVYSTSATPGSIFVVLLIICVSMVARNMCHVVRNMGKGKWKVSRTLLLKRIIAQEKNIQKQIYIHAGSAI